MRTKTSFRKTLVALVTALVLSSCSIVLDLDPIPPEGLIDTLDSYCADFKYAAESLFDAYGIQLTKYDPFDTGDLKEKEIDFSIPLAEKMVTITAEKTRGPEKYYRTPSDTKLWIVGFYGEHDRYPIRVQYCLLEDSRTMMIIANNESSPMAGRWDRACWYSISEEDGQRLLEVADETFVALWEYRASKREESAESDTESISQDPLSSY